MVLTVRHVEEETGKEGDKWRKALSIRARFASSSLQCLAAHYCGHHGAGDKSHTCLRFNPD